MKREASLQTACVRWFNLQHPTLGKMLIHVPNGGSRNPIEAHNMKLQGVVAGVADLLLLTPRKGFGCLCIEMKAERGRQSESQKAWEAAAKKSGNLYTVCRDVSSFMEIVNTYLS